MTIKMPTEIKWRDPLGVSGVNQAILQGDPTKPGLYIVMNKFKPGNFASRISIRTTVSSRSM